MATPANNGTDFSKKPSAGPLREDNNGSSTEGTVIEPLLRSWMSVTDRFLRRSTHFS